MLYGELKGLKFVRNNTRMKHLVGSPGTVSGLLLRLGQCLLAAGSIGVMVSASGFSNYTAFCYLIASMGLQVLWSSGLACLDIYALRIKRDLQNPVLVSLFVVGDWLRPVQTLRFDSRHKFHWKFTLNVTNILLSLVLLYTGH
ncbi:hypothetical protein KY290_006804 [Solanum tuberosum]|uniref:CASP-like protein n=1 Tax=Solanum tuberosum TaxID=4113 RepID=A0ABQ7WKD6_SOLTU|nr:hypothetical protein KY290_006804 [Solanum tuberosum]